MLVLHLPATLFPRNKMVAPQTFYEGTLSILYSSGIASYKWSTMCNVYDCTLSVKVMSRVKTACERLDSLFMLVAATVLLLFPSTTSSSISYTIEII
jgi:hypothetical protein